MQRQTVTGGPVTHGRARSIVQSADLLTGIATMSAASRFSWQSMRRRRDLWLSKGWTDDDARALVVLDWRGMCGLVHRHKYSVSAADVEGRTEASAQRSTAISLDLWSRDDIRNALMAQLGLLDDQDCSPEYWRGALAVATALGRTFGIVLPGQRAEWNVRPAAYVRRYLSDLRGENMELIEEREKGGTE